MSETPKIEARVEAALAFLQQRGSITTRETHVALGCSWLDAHYALKVLLDRGLANRIRAPRARECTYVRSESLIAAEVAGKQVDALFGEAFGLGLP